MAVRSMVITLWSLIAMWGLFLIARFLAGMVQIPLGLSDGDLTAMSFLAPMAWLLVPAIQGWEDRPRPT